VKRGRKAKPELEIALIERFNLDHPLFSSRQQCNAGESCHALYHNKARIERTFRQEVVEL